MAYFLLQTKNKPEQSGLCADVAPGTEKDAKLFGRAIEHKK